MVNPNVFLFGLGPMEIILIIALGVLLFGGRKFPELMKSIGQGVKEFRNESKGDEKNNKDTDKTKKSNE